MNEKFLHLSINVSLCFVCFMCFINQNVQAQTQDSIFNQKELNDSARKAVKNSFQYLKAGSSIPVLFGQQQKEKVLQSYGIISGEELQSFPVAQIESGLYGKFAGLFVQQFSGKPGDDAPVMTLRGRTPLVLVDGIARDITSIDPEQVASVSVLKDAMATAMYGMRGSEGVILIETRKGGIAPRKISFTAQTAIQKQLSLPSFLNATDYATLFNEALTNEGKQPLYTAEAIEKYRNGSDPIGFPNVDWYSTIMKDQATLQRYNLNFSGGNKIARYFVDLDYLGQDGFLVSDPKRNTYETSNSFKRYSFRTNIDVDLTQALLLSVNIFGRLRNANEPGGLGINLFGSDVIYNNLLQTPNNAYPVLNPDGTFGGNQQFQNNLYGQVVGSGYRPSYNRNLGVDLGLRQKLDVILPGLYAQGKLSYNTYYSEQISRNKSFAVYQYVTNPGAAPTITKFGTDGSQSNSSSIDLTYRQSYGELALGFDKISGQHEINTSLNFNADDYVVGSALNLTNTTLAGRFQYNYGKKYFAEVSAAYAGMNLYPGNKRWGLFPAVGLGWDIAREDFMKGVGLNSLKLRSTYGKTGNNSGAGYYVYRQFYNSSGSVYFGNPATSGGSMIEGTLANPNITWESADKFNIGADLSAFDQRLQLSLEYYNNAYYDLLQQRGTNASSMLGNNRPFENIGKRTYSGFELTAGYYGKSKNLNWFVNGNASLSDSKLDYIDEVIRPYEWMKRTGGQTNQIYGMVADGFFRDQTDIDRSAKIDGYKPVPGDIKYKDLNRDGVINVFDEQAIGNTKSMLFYGLTAGFNYKGFEFSMVWNGVANRDILVNGAGTYEFLATPNGGYGQAFTHHLDRWTPATAATASYPRLSVGSNINNQRSSSFWIKNGSYLRLKNVELAYSLPQNWISFMKMNRARIFVNGNNLLTLTKLDRVDPEVYVWNYPTQRVFNIGVNVQF
ncbi:TonB-linked SusC/RagA family outer membrane protein [Pedobacter africanus]|uniref:TonB-linked SusC/RagA family outer membrane protein n=1 Tax=Pedobacter africanus TaxID=151894 RepID=A0ACC6KXI2_9SPHI|nr:SusC/RagA family TonB-linked outer membrane protein [Pedobacter africanus]MDR6783839.1 TonB-linked SusC/RagA family outer membrane protein [Pedobacter africanus]